MVSTTNLNRIRAALIGLVVSCCWSVGANVIPTGSPSAIETVVAPPSKVEQPAAPSTTAAPIVHAVHTTAVPEIPKEHIGNHHTGAVVSTHAPVTHSPAPAIGQHHQSTAPPHHAAASPDMSVVTIHSTVLPTIAPISHVSKEVCTGFCDYIKPICDSLSKISVKQMFMIQTQFKQFVQKTNGQMSLCFVEHYSLDPTFKPVSHDDLTAICASRKHSEGKGSFAAFQACASAHWDPELDKTLASIKEVRANSTSHPHAENGAVATNIEHDEEELSMISEVVNKVLGNPGGNLNASNSDVKVIDVTGKTTAAPAPSVVNGSAHTPLVVHHGTTLPPAASNKSLLNDPNNTVVVFLDDKTTTPAPVNQTVHVNSTIQVSANTTTIKPASNNSTSSHIEVKATTVGHSGNSTTMAPILSTKAPAINGTTIKPANVNGTTTVAPATVKPNDKASSTSAPSLTTKSPPTTPASNSTTATPTKPATATTTTKAPDSTTTTAKPTLKPIETLEQILHRQEKEKQDLDNKLKAERTKAFNQLKKQDNTASHHSAAADAKIHQIEHERQMSIDPIGHTIRHQQYEASKQKKSSPAS